MFPCEIPILRFFYIKLFRLRLLLVIGLVAGSAFGPGLSKSETVQSTLSNPDGSRSTQPPRMESLPPEKLLVLLREGGLIIYFRHGITDWSQTDKMPLNLKQCSAQRNLSKAGQAQMEAIGRAVSVLGIRVAKVFASPYCRTLDSARLAFGRVVPESRLQYVGPMRGKRREQQVDALRNLLAQPPPDGRNMVLIAHRGNLLEATSVDLEEGEAALFRPSVSPEGKPDFRLVGRLNQQNLESLAELETLRGERDEECREPGRIPSA